MPEKRNVGYFGAFRDLLDGDGGKILFEDQGHQGITQQTTRPAHTRISFYGGSFTRHGSPFCYKMRVCITYVTSTPVLSLTCQRGWLQWKLLLHSITKRSDHENNDSKLRKDLQAGPHPRCCKADA